MKVSFLEPLGIPQESLKNLVDESLGSLVEATYYDTRVEDAATLTERSKGADCVVLSNIRYGKDIISQLPDLKMICVAFTGVDLVDVDYCREKGIMVCNCAGYSTVAVADLVFGFVIDLARNILACDKAVRQGGTKAGLVGWELEGKKFGVIGAGAIGCRVLRSRRLSAARPMLTAELPRRFRGVKFVSLDELLKVCDIVSVHVPQNPQTVGMIGKEQFCAYEERRPVHQLRARADCRQQCPGGSAE